MLTWLSLVVLIVLYPAQGFLGDPTEMLKSIDSGMQMIIYVSTIIFQWFIFLLLLIATYRENTLLKGIGVVRPRLMDLAWGVSGLLMLLAVAFVVTGAMLFFGLKLPGELEFLIPKDTAGRIMWVILSLTAGFCEETAFRGYLMTRLRLVGKTNGWFMPVVVSTVAFGLCHSYQGIAGFILISVLGLVFAFLYIRTRSIWPAVIAHSLLDLVNIIVPR